MFGARFATGVRAGLASIARGIRPAFLWALGVSATTAVVSSVGRTICLPPYWPSDYVLRCRSGTLGAALLHLPADALLTTLFLAVPALPAGAATHLFVSGLQAAGYPGAARVLGGVAGAVLWVWLARHLETSYLDFILGGYAIGAGAIVGARLAGWWPGRRTE